MPFAIQGTDTSGSVSLRRENTAAAVKKAAELIADGCWDVRITTPDGRVYASTEFDQLQSDAKT
jgi:glycerophosphoryl diester phosphodiesterase